MPRLKRGIASRTLFAAHDEYEGGDDRSGVSQAEGLDRVGEEGGRRWQIRYHTGFGMISDEGGGSTMVRLSLAAARSSYSTLESTS